MVAARLNGIGDLLELGRWDEVAASVAEYFEVDVPELGIDWELGSLVVHAVWLHVRQGDLGAAHRIVDEYMVAREGERMDLVGLHEAARAALKNADGDHEVALQIAEQALRSNFDGLAVDLRLALIEALDAAFDLRRYEKVVELIDSVRADVPPGRHASLDLQVTRFEARLAAARGDHDEAGVKFRAASDGFLALDRPFWVAVSRLEHAESLLAQGSEPEARDLLAVARATFVALRAQPWLERLDAAVAGSRSVREGVLSA
jgi:ATP/maltotriose-dependent transcriptional regulator MalT